MDSDARDRWKNETLVERLNGALTVAFVGALPASELADRFDTSFQHSWPLRSQFLRRLSELCAESDVARSDVSRLIQRIKDARAQLPTRKRRSADSTLAHLAALMAPDDAVSLIAELALGDPWWRRAAAYKAMKRSPEHAWESVLREAYTRYRDEEALVMLMRGGGNPLELCKDDLGDTLATLRDNYRRSLVLQQVLVRDERLALELGSRFATPLAWAIGRLCVDAATVLEFIDAAADVGLLCWAMGRLGGVEELLAIAQRFGISELLEEH